MNAMIRRLSLFLTALLGFLTAASAVPTRVGVSVLPLESLVREIGGDLVEVSSLQKAGDSCSVFEPRPSTIGWMSGAALFFRTGVGFENSILPKLGHQNKGLKIVDLRDALDETELVAVEHDHGHDHHHEHCEVVTDPHVWLNPNNLSRMAYLVAEALSGIRPEDRELFLQNANRFALRMKEVDREIRELLQPYSGRPFFIYHPALGCFAKAYGLEQVPIEASGQAPSIAELQHLITRARRDAIHIIFVQPQESRRQAELVAKSAGCRVATIDPMSPELEENLFTIARSLVDAFSGQ